MEEFTTSFVTTSRYYVLGKRSPQITRIWFALHGYGQLARYFGQKFAPLVDERTLFVFPEGSHKFYLEDVRNHAHSRIGASWMTRENRLTEIENYCNYLTGIRKEITRGKNAKLGLFGFSQGCATAVRWLASGGIEADRLVLWAGVFPKDIPPDKINKINATCVYGTEDPWLTSEQLEEIRIQYPACQLISFRGGHEIDPTTLPTVMAGN